MLRLSIILAGLIAAAHADGPRRFLQSTTYSDLGCAWVAEFPGVPGDWKRCRAKGVIESTLGKVFASYACPKACGTPCHDDHDVKAGSEVEILILNTGLTTEGGVPTVVGGGFAEAAFSGQYGPLAKSQAEGMKHIVTAFLGGTLPPMS